MHGVRWVSGLAMDFEATFEKNVSQGLHVGLASSRNSNLEHIDSELVSFNKQIVVVLIFISGLEISTSHVGARL